VRRTRDPSISGQLESGWGALLKPVAWQGCLINGPSDGSTVTFTSPHTWLPGWTALPGPAEAARLIIPAYLGAFGPASMKVFDQWLVRGRSRKAALRSWFTALVSDGEEAGPVPAAAIEAEAAHLGAFLGTSLTVSARAT
jgi:hypothetical protein